MSGSNRTAEPELGVPRNTVPVSFTSWEALLVSVDPQFMQQARATTAVGAKYNNRVAL